MVAGSFPSNIQTFLATGGYPALLLLAWLAYLASVHLKQSQDPRRWNGPMAVGLIACLAFCLYTYATSEELDGEEIWDFLDLGFRGILTGVMARGIATVIFSLITAVLAAPRPRPRVRKPRRVRPPKRRRRIKPLPPPPEPAVVLRGEVQRIKAEHDAACRTLEAAGLDPDELESALVPSQVGIVG